MKLPNINPAYVIGGGVLLAMGYVWMRGAKGVATDIGGAVVDVADGVLSGAVTGVGSVVGVPQTNLTKCQKAMAEGRTWDASFDCPASTWIKYLWD